MFNQSPIRIFVIAVSVVAASATGWYLLACPFCSAINLTFAEQIKSNDIVVIAKLMEIPEPVDDPDVEIPKSVFEITDVIKGQETVRQGMTFRSLLVGKYPIGDRFLVMGVDPPKVAWSTPMRASDRVVNYLQTIQKLPESGPERLAFFQDYFEDRESVLAFDAYDEFAAAPYSDIQALKDKMNREQLLAWINDSEISTNRRRLYFVLLSVCGEKSDIEMLESFIKSGDRKKQAGLDSLISCYLTLKGKEGIPLVVKTFLQDTEVEYVDTLAAVSALRFHGSDEVDFVPRQDIVKAVRTLLDRPNIADMIIPDLANWEDWSVIERLVKMFKEADEDTNWVRVPIASYLRACPKPEAKTYIAELQKIDPDSIKRADFFLMLDDEEEEADEDAEDETVASKSEDSKSADSDQSPTTNQQNATTQSGKQPSSNDKKDNELSNDRDDQSKSNEAKHSESTTIPLEETYVAHRVPLNSNMDSTVAANQQPVNNVVDVMNLANESQPMPALADNSVQAANAVSNVAAQTNPELTPVATSDIIPVPTWKLLLIPFVCSACIFILLLSVISGWFDRLIY